MTQLERLQSSLRIFAWMNPSYGSFDGNWIDWPDDVWTQWEAVSSMFEADFASVITQDTGVLATDSSVDQCGATGAQTLHSSTRPHIDEQTRFNFKQNEGTSMFSNSLTLAKTDPPDCASARKQDTLSPGDLYTAQWVRGEGSKREGWCGFCSNWYIMKDSAYW